MGLTQWSFSRLHQFEECPRKAKYLYIDRMKEPPSDVLEEGSRVHALGEAYLKNGGEVPPEYAKFGLRLAGLRSRKAQAEVEWAFRRDMTPCGWFDHDVWLRVKVDALLMTPFTIIDYKTGKPKEWYADQLALYALAALTMFPTKRKVGVEAWYLASGASERAEFRLSDRKALAARFAERVERYEAETIFPPLPGFHCRWCAFSKAKGGPCEF